MLKLVLEASGKTFDDLALALQEAQSQVAGWFRYGIGSNEDGEYSFDISGDEEEEIASPAYET